MTLFITTLSFVTYFSLSLAQNEVEAFGSCCTYCRPEGHIWTENSNAWNLSVNDYHVLDFRSPSSYFLHDSSSSYHAVRDGVYKIHHAGAPLTISRTSIGDEAYILSRQYLQLDLGAVMDVVGVTTQGGFYRDEEDELLYVFHGWVTAYALSYTGSASLTGTYSYYRHEDGYVQVFNANNDASTAVLNSLDHVISTRALRFHPLGGGSNRGPVSQTLVRIGVIVCNRGSTSCSYPRVNCEAGNWVEWGECSCTSSGCKQKRERPIYRYNACGGAACPDTQEQQVCTEDKAPWQDIVIYAAVGLAAFVVILIIVILLVKRHKIRQQAVIFDRQTLNFNNAEAYPKDSDSQTKIRDADDEDDEDAGTDLPISPRQIHMEASAPDREQMYGKQRSTLGPNTNSDDVTQREISARRRGPTPRDDGVDYAGRAALDLHIDI